MTKKTYPQSGTVKQYHYSQCSQCGEEKKANTSSWCKYCITAKLKGYQPTIIVPVEPVPLKANPVVPEKVVDKRKSLADFIEPIIKRNHYASYAELMMVIDYWTTIFKDKRKYETQKGLDQICCMYRDLVRIYSKQKMAFQKKYIPYEKEIIKTR